MPSLLSLPKMYNDFLEGEVLHAFTTFKNLNSHPDVLFTKHNLATFRFYLQVSSLKPTQCTNETFCLNCRAEAN